MSINMLQRRKRRRMAQKRASAFLCQMDMNDHLLVTYNITICIQNKAVARRPADAILVRESANAIMCNNNSCSPQDSAGQPSPSNIHF